MGKDVLRPVDDDARALAKRLLRTATQATLASLEPRTGWPYASLVTVATSLDGIPSLLVSALSLHTRALAADPRCSLLLQAGGPGDPLAHARLTIFGGARFLERPDPDEAAVRRRFLGRHPKAALYAGFGDFSFVTVQPERAVLNAGFGRASELSAPDFVTPLADALQPLVQSEAAAVAHMNADHPDAVRLIATRLCGGEDGDWQVIGLDPDGVDLALDGRCLRYEYTQPLTDAKQLRVRLVEITRRARQQILP